MYIFIINRLFNILPKQWSSNIIYNLYKIVHMYISISTISIYYIVWLLDPIHLGVRT